MKDGSKKAYKEKPETKLKEWSADFDKLKEKVERPETTIKEECHKGSRMIVPDERISKKGPED